MSAKQLDCSDIDQYLGKPMRPARMVEPLHNNDFRRWAQAMHYPNRLHYDADYAVEGRWRRMTAPQSFAIACDDANGCAPHLVGKIPDSHHLYVADEWWFHGPRIFGGDRIHNERIPYDYTIKETRLAGPTCFQRGDNNYYNDRQEKIATLRSTGIRYTMQAGRETAASAKPDLMDEPDWSEEQLAHLEDRKLAWIHMLHELEHGKRWWDDVKVGETLPERVVGPHSLVSFSTECRAYLMNIWGTMHRAGLDPEALGFAFSGRTWDAELEKRNPESTDAAYVGPSRGHLFPRWARLLGMPRAYGYGASMGAWILDYFAGFAGEWGSVVHSLVNYRGPALVGDITITTGRVLDKLIDEQGRNLVQLECRMANQLDVIVATAKAEILLPIRG